MALQPNQRATMRGKMTTAKRAQPRLVNRTNKSVLPELLPEHEKNGPRFASRMAWNRWFKEWQSSGWGPV